MVDIAVRKSTPTGMRLVSFFDVITDELFEDFQQRGVVNREDLIIARDERDADLLICDGEVFTNTGTLPGWFTLKP